MDLEIRLATRTQGLNLMLSASIKTLFVKS